MNSAKLRNVTDGGACKDAISRFVQLLYNLQHFALLEGRRKVDVKVRLN